MHLICYMPFDMYPWNLLPSWGANGEILNPKCFSSQQYERTMFLWANYSGIFWSPKFCENFSIFLGVTAEPILYIYLSHKLRCYRGISGPEKSRNNTREKISSFFTCVGIANQLLTLAWLTRLWRHAVKLINDWQRLHHSQYKLFVGAFSNYGG